jgi:hypothetical protein
LYSIGFSVDINSTPQEKRRTLSPSENIAQTTSIKSKNKREKGEESLDQSMKIGEETAKKNLDLLVQVAFK